MLHKKKSEIEVLGIKYFFDKFEKEGRRYAPSIFFGEGTRRTRPVPCPFPIYKKIIFNYLFLYFYNLYMEKDYSYFFLGGFMKKVRYKKWISDTVNKFHKKRCQGNRSIGLFWYMRPSMRMHYMVAFHKMAGSTSRLKQIEKIFEANNDKDIIPIFISELKKARKGKTLYRCIQT